MIGWLDALLDGADEQPPLVVPRGLQRLAASLDVSDALPALALVAAPDLDRGYGVRMGALAGDGAFHGPTPQFVAALLGSHARDQTASLVRAGLVHEDAGILRADTHVLALLLGGAALHPALAACARVVEPHRPSWPRGAADIDAVAGAARDGGIRLWLAGVRRERAEAAAAALAVAVRSPLLSVDLPAAIAADPSLERIGPVLVREAWLRDAVLLLLGADVLFDADGRPARGLARALAADRGAVLLQGERSTPAGVLDDRARPLGVVVVTVPPPDATERDAAWREALREHGLSLRAARRRTLAARFRLDPDEIHGAVARGAATLRSGLARDVPTALLDAARLSRSHRLATVATRVEVRAGWDDLQLPSDTHAQVAELIALATQRERVWEVGGFGWRTSRGRGVSALFSGASGTGKTTAAEVVAGELGFELYRIDLATIVSKYIGETEKNLDAVFAAAEGSNAVLLFDEAEALFGRRSEVQDAHDRYANVEIAYLLQRIEAYDGVAILTSNLRHHVDEAFLRRLTCSITFPIPDADGRRRLWQSAWPVATAVASDVDRDALAARYRLTGGGVRNVALYAAHLALADGRPVGPRDVEVALRREYGKLGVALQEASA